MNKLTEWKNRFSCRKQIHNLWSPQIGVIFFLIFCAVLPYANALLNGFVHDDGAQILQNPYIRSFRYIKQIFSTSVWSFAGTPSRYYRPMMTFGYLLCYKLFGFSAAAFHLVNLALHAAIVCLLFEVTKRMFQDRILSLAAAAAFALHPIHTESVVWIAAVTDLELTIFYLLTFWLFLSLGSSRSNHFILRYLSMIGSFILALLSKEQAVTLPFLALVYEHFYREDRAETKLAVKFLRYFPLWLLAMAYLPIRVLSLGGFLVTSNYLALTRKEVILSAISLTGQYLGKLFWPAHLCAFYVFDKSTRVLDPAVLAGTGCGILLCVVFWFLWKHARPVSFGLIWLIVTLAPVLDPKWLGVNVFAERYLYLPSVGFCWILGWGLAALWKSCSGRRTWRIVVATVLSSIAVLAVLRIGSRNREWRDDLTLYTRTLEDSPEADIIRVSLASLYQNQGLFSEAERQYRIVLERQPDCVECLNDIAWLFLEQGRYDDSIPLLKRAVGVDPRDVRAHLNLGAVYQHAGLVEKAAKEFHTAMKLAPQDARVHSTAGLFYEQQGDHFRAESAYKNALSINPYNSRIRVSLARLYETEHRTKDAIQQLQTALQNEPENFEAIIALRRLKTSRNP